MLQSVWFPALLKSPDGEVLECGTASIMLETGDVNFKSDFVPLYPLGEELVITRLDEGNEIANYKGKVYISSRELMRLVNVEREIIADSSYVFRGLPFSGTLRPLVEEKPAKGLFGLKLKSKSAREEEVIYEVNVLGLGLNTLEFRYGSDAPFERGQRLQIKLALPIDFPETVLDIKEALVFGENALYRCEMPELADTERQMLMQFLLLLDISSDPSL